jgi:hypothetical protein
MDCAPWQNIHNYLKKYADKFHLIDWIRFQTDVLLIHKDDLKHPNLPWTVKVETATGHYQTFEFDLVVVANVLFSTPEKPLFRGQNKFAGSIVHITEIKRQDQFENKRVIVLGGAKEERRSIGDAIPPLIFGLFFVEALIYWLVVRVQKYYHQHQRYHLRKPIKRNKSTHYAKIKWLSKRYIHKLKMVMSEVVIQENHQLNI